MDRIAQKSDSIDPHVKGMHINALERVVAEHDFYEAPFGLVETNEKLRNKLLDQMCVFIEHYLKKEIGLFSERDLKKDIFDFYKSHKNNPAKKVRRGAAVDVLNLWLHLITRQIKPTTIVESGVGFGRSLYTLRNALDSAEIHAFDVSFSWLPYRDESISYYEHDWSESDVKCQDIGFCFFDDHINNGRRIREAYERGFTHLVFDQCAPTGMVHLYRYPGLPSAIMIGEDILEEDDLIEWIWQDQKMQYQFAQEHTYDAKDLIEVVKPLPSLERWVGKSPGQAAYVRLKQNNENDNTVL